MVGNEVSEQNIIEPVELESLKSYLGIVPERTEEDDLLDSLIASARSRIEDRLGRAITRRKFEKTVYDPGCYNLIPSLISVIDISYTDLEGDVRKIDNFRVRKGDEARVCFSIDDPFFDSDQGIKIVFESGYDVCPESLKIAILKVCKLDHERSTDDAIQAVWTDIQSYRVENI